MRKCSLAATLLLAIVVVAPADPLGWTDDVLVAAGSHVNRHTGLAIGAFGGCIHVAGATCSNSQEEWCNLPWYTRSTDGGQTWEPPRTICAGQTAWNKEQIALVADGGTVVALAPASLEGILRDFSPDNGATWEGASYFGQGLRPAVTSLWNGRYAVWDDVRFGGPDNTELFFKRSTDQGHTWGPPPGQGVPPDSAMRLTDLPGRSEDADICSEVPVQGAAPPPQPCGYIIVVWADNYPGGQEDKFNLRINWSGNGGETWAYGFTGHEVKRTEADSRYPAIDCYEAAYPWTLHLVWQEGENGIYYTRSSDRGASWDSLQQIGTGYHPDVMVDQHGVHVVWWTHGLYTDVIKYRRSTDFGTTWGPVIQLTSLQPALAYSDSRFPKITADAQGRHVVFGDSRQAGDALACWYKQNPISSSPGGQSSAGTTPAALVLLTARPNPTRGPVTVRLVGGSARITEVTVTDVQGRTVRRLSCTGAETRWDGRDDQGRQVAAGVYHLRVAGLGAMAQTQVLVLR